MINYLKGDATLPQTPGNAIIVHVCNDIGAWGAGFVLALSNRWPEPEAAYRQWANEGKALLGDDSKMDQLVPPKHPEFKLGSVQFVSVDPHILVANMIGQHNVRRGDSGQTPVRYHAIRKGLARVREVAILKGASVHMPRIGCGLAGGIWEEVEDLILNELVSQGVEVYVYDFN
jgi:O-acetyl-ADP-ribose deacetylase (regulator of RNase III)